MVRGTEEHLTRIEWLLLVELVQNTGRVIAYEEPAQQDLGAGIPQ